MYFYDCLVKVLMLCKAILPLLWLNCKGSLDVPNHRKIIGQITEKFVANMPKEFAFPLKMGII